MNFVTAVLVIVCACCTVCAAAQDVPSTAQATGGVGLHGVARPFFGVGAGSHAKPSPAQELPHGADRQVVEVREGGRLAVRWTTEHRPSAAEWRRQVAESMANQQSFADHDAVKTVVTDAAGRDPAVWVGRPAEEAFGRLHDPLSPGALQGDPLVEDPTVGLPPMDSEGVRRLLEPWSPEHGFGEGRAD